MDLREIKRDIKKGNKIWIVPSNDLEAKTIIELLERNGEDYIVTSQGWGASWEMIEPEVFEQLRSKRFEIEDEYIGYLREYDQQFQNINEEISKIYGEIYAIKAQNNGNEEIEDILKRKQIITKLEEEKTQILEKRQKMASDFWFSINRQANEKGISIYGVELAGKSRGAIDIDHHNERSNEKSSIEQVAYILGVELNIDEQFVAANDKGFIPEMEELGKELGIREDELKAIIANIRMRDRRMQGITIEQENQAQVAVESLGEIEEVQQYILVDGLPHSKTSTITDRLYGKYHNLLITSQDGETNFYGSADIIKILNEKFPGGWFGGQLEKGTGFWGGYADQKAIKEAVQQEIDKKIKEKQKQEKIKEFWLKQYSKDKIGTIAKLSQAMQHGAWLREWQRIHGDEPRIKPITQKINGEKVKVGEADIAVPWSKLPGFFRRGNEYGDIETVKFLADRIERGDISDLSEEELHDLSERENVKWSDGVHSLNPFQGYLYDFTSVNDSILGADYGEFKPIRGFEFIGKPMSQICVPERVRETYVAFQRYYTTRLMQQLLSSMKDSKYYDFVNFDITSVTTEEQIKELDKKLAEIVKSPEIQEKINKLYGNEEYEKRFYEELMEEIRIEIKKDSDRIENAHKVFVALETGKLDEVLSDPETARWAKEIYEEEKGKEELGIGNN